MYTNYNTKDMVYSEWFKRCELIGKHVYDIELTDYIEYDYKDAYRRGITPKQLANEIARDQLE
jgi:hypothetical protein